MNDDVSQPVATIPDGEYTLSIDEAALRYDHAGHPRTPRSIQRYCAKGHLDCRRMETSFGEKFLITPASVAKHIAYIEEVRPVATGLDMSRHAAAGNAELSGPAVSSGQPPTGDDMSRHVSTQPEADHRYVAQLEKDNEFLRGQMGVKDKTIDALLERDRETNILVGQLQRMLAPLLRSPERQDDGRSISHADISDRKTQDH